MQRLPLATLAVVLFELAGIAGASARPSISLSLAGAIVHHDAKGDSLTPLAGGASLQPGETVRYSIVATNAGSDAALGLTPSARIPAGTSYQSGSAAATLPVHVEYSLDGKAWSSAPTIATSTPNGIVRKAAPASAYTMVRFHSDRELAAHASATYSYLVRVK